MKTYPLVLIRWLDSSQPMSNWQFLTEIPEEQAVQCETVGFLIHETTDTLTIAMSLGSVGLKGIGEPDQACGVMTIPVVAITSRTGIQGRH